MAKKFSEKVVVVTGSSAGLGKAIALAFAKEGAHVGLIARNEERLQLVRKEVESHGVQCLARVCDVSNGESVEEAAAAFQDYFGVLDIWINNAMVSVFSPVKEMTFAEYRRVTEVTYLGTVYGTMAALKRMMKRDQGVIIQVGSTLAYRGIPLQSAYCASKHATQGFHDSLSSELLYEGSKVKVCMVQMPALNTPQFDWVKSRLPRKPQPVPPIFQPEVGAQAVLWLAEHPRREFNVTFLTSVLIVGNSFFPGFGDWYLAKTGYKGQQTQEIEERDRPDNLWKSVDGEFGAHGRFDKTAHAKNSFFWLKTQARFVWIIILFLIIVLMTL